MLAEMKSSVPASKRIRQLVNTHANGDHTYGNQLVEGAEIIACRACAEEYAEAPPEKMIQRAQSWRNLGVGLDYQYKSVNSNVAGQSFDQQVVSLGIAYRY